MRLSFGQEMRMVQKQVLAPRMIQSMEILQLPIMELQERIDQEMQENPLLEMTQEEHEQAPPEEAGEMSAADAPPEVENPDAPAESERELVVNEEGKGNADDFERLLNMNEEWPDYFEERSRPSSQRVEEDSDRKHDAMSNMADRPQSLHDYLTDQLAWFDLKPEVRQMAERIIYALDANGYLTTRLEDLVDPTSMAVQLPQAEQALSIVQKLDPLGIAARNLKECLLLQLTQKMPFYEHLQKLISNHLEALEHNRLPLIEKKTGYTLETIQAALVELKKLNPKPGANFRDDHIPNVTPDVYVDVNEKGEYKVRLQDDRIPQLYISNYYRNMLMSEEVSEETKEYIKRKINSAQWLIESIEQRRGTLTKVSQAIVDHQLEFLNKGCETIEPLKMQQIADKVKVHVTTVSRAVDDKWMQTPRGIFPMKRFFGGGTVSADGEEVAWDAVRLKLQEIVDHEDKKSPWSDDDLVKELAKHGITVARRTVTKYRKAMNIPSSRQRRDWTQGEAPAAADRHSPLQQSTAHPAPISPASVPHLDEA